MPRSTIIKYCSSSRLPARPRSRRASTCWPRSIIQTVRQTTTKSRRDCMRSALNKSTRRTSCSWTRTSDVITTPCVRRTNPRKSLCTTPKRRRRGSPARPVTSASHSRRHDSTNIRTSGGSSARLIAVGTSQSRNGLSLMQAASGRTPGSNKEDRRSTHRNTTAGRISRGSMRAKGCTDRRT